MGILFAAFISIFALDVFGEGYGFWGTIVALLMHMVPTFLITGALLAGWRWEWPGAVLFIGLGIFYIVMSRGRMDIAACLPIPGPAFLVGALFLINWIRKRNRTTSASD